MTMSNSSHPRTYKNSGVDVKETTFKLRNNEDY